MTKYILKRIILAIIAVAIIAIVVYFLINLSSRSPIDKTSFATEDEYQAALKAVGLDKPIWERFGVWVKDIFTGKGFGTYYQDPTLSISGIFFSPLKYTLWITIPAFLFSMILGITLGFIAGYNRGNWVDSFINIFVVFFMGVPSFLLAAFALILGEQIGLPISFQDPNDFGYRAMLLSILIPVALLTFTSLITYTYYTRNEVVTVLTSNHVLIARSKGMSEFQVFKKHVLRNVSIPLISIIFPSFLFIMAGSLVIETFFQVPGSSSIIIAAISNAEYNLIMFNTLFFAVFGLFTNILIDILYVLIDPRIRYSEFENFKLIEKARYQNIRLKNALVEDHRKVKLEKVIIKGGANEER